MKSVATSSQICCGVAEAMKQMENNFKAHAEAQLTSYTKLLEEYLATTYLRFSQMQQQFAELNAVGKGDNGGRGSNVNGNGRDSGGGSAHRDVGVDQGTNHFPPSSGRLCGYINFSHL